MLLPLIGLAAAEVVAVAYFDAHSVRPELEPLGRGVADMLTTDLGSAPGLVLVERARIAEVLAELELGKGGFVDPATAQKLGKGLGANLIVVGSLTVAIEGMRIDARVVDVATGEVRAASQATGKEDQFFALEDEVARELLAGLGLSAAVEERPIALDQIVASSRAIDASDEAILARLRGLREYKARRFTRVVGAGGGWVVLEGGNTPLSARDFAERTADTETLARIARARRSGLAWGWGTFATSVAATAGGVVLTASAFDDSLTKKQANGAIAGGISLASVGGLGLMGGLVIGLGAPLQGTGPVGTAYTPEAADGRITEYNRALAARFGLSESDVLAFDLGGPLTPVGAGR